MPILSSGTTYPLTIPAGNALVTIDLSGTSTVTGVTREDASRWHGAGAKACNPVSTATAITISTTGKVDYRLVAGDATPSSESFKYNPVTFDSTPSDVAAVAAALGGAVFGETLGTEAGIRYAAALAAAAGGGIVQLQPKTYTVTSPLPVYSGVVYRGAGWKANVANAIPDDGGVLPAAGSTILYGDGTFAMFQLNTTPLTNAAATTLYGGYGTTASQKAFASYAATGFGAQDLAIQNVTYGVWAGAQNVPSFFWSQFRNVAVFGATQWAAWIENQQHMPSGSITAFGCTHGVCIANSCGALLSTGNTKFDSLYGVTPLTGNIASRCLVFLAYNNSILNSVSAAYSQGSRFNQAYSNQAATMSNGVADIGVTDLSKFALNQPVTFVSSSSGSGLPVSKSTVNGLTLGRTYYVLSKSAATGAGTLQVATKQSDFSTGAPAGFITSTPSSVTAVTPTGNSAVRILTTGFPSIEVIGLDTSSCNGFEFSHCDVEAGGAAQIALQAVTNSRFHIPVLDASGSTASAQTVSLRNCTGVSVWTGFYARWDDDGTGAGNCYYGGLSSYSNVMPLGVYYDSTTGRQMINLSRFQSSDALPSFINRSPGNADWTYPGLPVGVHTGYSTTATQSINVGSTLAGCGVYTGTGAGTWTWGQGFSADLKGFRQTFVNKGTGALTITLGASDGTFGGMTGGTSSGKSISLAAPTTTAPGGSLTIVCAQTGASSYEWQVESWVNATLV